MINPGKKIRKKALLWWCTIQYTPVWIWSVFVWNLYCHFHQTMLHIGLIYCELTIWSLRFTWINGIITLALLIRKIFQILTFWPWSPKISRTINGRTRDCVIDKRCKNVNDGRGKMVVTALIRLGYLFQSAF